MLGGDGADTLLGGAGDDWIFLDPATPGKIGVDVIEGGDGIDMLFIDRYQQSGNFTLTLQDGAGVHHLRSGTTYSGIERLSFSGFAGDDIVTGGAFDDVMGDGYGGADVFRGLGGNDALSASVDGSRLYGGAGDDLVGMTTNLMGVAVVEGGDGVDVLELGIFGVSDGLALSVADLQGSYALTDSITLSGFESILLYGGSGDDTVRGGVLDDTMYGQGGRDVLTDSAGQNVVHGGSEGDQISASGRLYGNGGHDVMAGGAGADRLSGGFGQDTMTGGGRGGSVHL